MLRPDLPEDWDFQHYGMGLPFSSKMTPEELRAKQDEQQSVFSGLKTEASKALAGADCVVM